MLVSFICWLLKRKTLKTSERQRLTNEILSAIDALPLHAIITVDGNKFSIRGVPLDGDKAIAIRDSASQAIHNQALAFVHEQVLYQAVSLGIHQAHTPEQIQFAKAAIWYAQEEKKLLVALSQEDPRELLA